MKTIIYHIKGITKTIELLLKGNFLLFFIPGAIITLFFLWLRSLTSSLDAAADLTSDTSWWNSVLEYLNSGIHKAFSIFNFLIDQLYIFIVLTVLSPFNTFLGEKMDTKLTGQEFGGGFIRFINDFFRMIFVVLLALILQFFALGIYWIISYFIDNPFIDEIAYFLISAFFFGFSFYDFALERYEINVMGSLGFAFRNPLTMILTGGIFLLIYNIPLIGIPISPVITLMISTVVYLYIRKRLPLHKVQNIDSNE